MKHTLIYSVTMAIILAACSDAVDPARFDVGIATGTGAAGEPVRFLFNGNPDYITFYSGEDGCDYNASDRYEADITALRLSCSVRQQYNSVEYLGQQLIFAYVSTDFNGDYSPEGINAASWTPITGDGDNCLPVPVPASAAAVSCSGSIDLGQYTGTSQPFYIAFLYNAPGRATIPPSNGGGRYVVKPRIDITDLIMTKTLDDGSIKLLDNASDQFGLRPVYESSYNRTNFRVNDDGLLFQPAQAVADPLTGREPDERVWMATTLIDPRKVDPDRGIPIKSIEGRLTEYEHVYSQPGTYTATFVATNANMWDSKSTIRQLTVSIR